MVSSSPAFTSRLVTTETGGFAEKADEKKVVIKKAAKKTAVKNTTKKAAKKTAVKNTTQKKKTTKSD